MVDFPVRRCGRTPTRRCATASGPSGPWSSTAVHRRGRLGQLAVPVLPVLGRPDRQYNEFVYAFFKCLSEERLQYAEGWYDEHQRTTDAEDITWAMGGPASCPHLKADLTRFGIVDGGTLTCQLHGWKFDLASGRCLTSAGHGLRAPSHGRTSAGLNVSALMLVHPCVALRESRSTLPDQRPALATSRPSSPRS